MVDIAWPDWRKRRLIGRRISRLDGPQKTTGVAKYAYDINRPGLLYARIFSSPIASGTLRSLDLSAAEAMPGVEVVHAIVEPGGEVRWVGQEVAAVAATSEEIAAEAIKRIRAEFEPAAPVVDDTDPANRQGRERTREEGEPDRAFNDAAASVSDRYGCSVITHCCLESHGQTCEFQGDELMVWPSTQNVSGYAPQVAQAAGVDAAKVHIDTQYMGGGFGSKFGAGLWGTVCTTLAKMTGKPIKLMLERDQELMIAGNRPSAYSDVRIAADANGILTGWESTTWGTGGLGGFREPPLPYVFDIPNRRTSSQAIPTNRGPAQAWRAPGHPQGCLITMSAIADCAAALGMDELEFFRRNLHLTNPDLQDTYWEELEIAADMIGYQEKAHRRGDPTPGPIKRGLGISMHTWGGAGHASTCDVSIQPDGSVSASVGTQDLGTGARTCVGIVVADSLGLPLDAVQVNIGRNSYPNSGASGGSTTIGGISSSSRRAAVAALNQLLERVSAETGIAADRLEAFDGRIQEIDNPAQAITWQQACRMLAQPITAQGSHGRGGDNRLANSGVGGVQMADVSVDIETGIVTMNKMVAVQDCGLIIDMKTAESQVYGAMIMGITSAIYEETIYDHATGVMLNADMEFYRLAGLSDIGDLQVHMMTGRNYDDRGVIGLGEPPAISPMAAISNAVANAIGTRVGTVPLTADRVLDALARGGQSA